MSEDETCRQPGLACGWRLPQLSYPTWVYLDLTWLRPLLSVPTSPISTELLFPHQSNPCPYNRTLGLLQRQPFAFLNNHSDERWLSNNFQNTFKNNNQTLNELFLSQRVSNKDNYWWFYKCRLLFYILGVFIIQSSFSDQQFTLTGILHFFVFISGLVHEILT